MSKDFLDVDIFTQLPQSLGNDDGVVNLFKAIDKELKEIVNKRKYLYLIANIDILPEKIIELLAWQWHVDFWDADLSLERKRPLVKNSIRWHRIKGTPAAVEEVVTAAYGNCKLEEWFEYDGKPYFFKVKVNLEEESSDKGKWKNVIAAINSAKNVRSWLEEIKFYYPEILIPVNIKHVASILQIVDAKHCFWNLGSVSSAFWDGTYMFDGMLRWDGMEPDQLYREKMWQTIKMFASIKARQQSHPKTNVFYGLNTKANIKFEFTHSSKQKSIASPNTKFTIKSEISSLNQSSFKQSHSKHKIRMDGTRRLNRKCNFSGVFRSRLINQRVCIIEGGKKTYE